MLLDGFHKVNDPLRYFDPSNHRCITASLFIVTDEGARLLSCVMTMGVYEKFIAIFISFQTRKKFSPLNLWKRIDFSSQHHTPSFLQHRTVRVFHHRNGSDPHNPREAGFNNELIGQHDHRITANGVFLESCASVRSL